MLQHHREVVERCRIARERERESARIDRDRGARDIAPFENRKETIRCVLFVSMLKRKADSSCDI